MTPASKAERLKAALWKFVSWVDFHLTGVPWHQRAYGRIAFSRYAPLLTGKSQPEADRFIVDAMEGWRRRAIESEADE